jgi:hypothetical protein
MILQIGTFGPTASVSEVKTAKKTLLRRCAKLWCVLPGLPFPQDTQWAYGLVFIYTLPDRGHLPVALSLHSSRGSRRRHAFGSLCEVPPSERGVEIERQAKRMQSVIELTRHIREKNNCSLKRSRFAQSSR